MSIDHQSQEDACIVCGKPLKPGEAQATLHQGKSKLPICCVLCLERYQADPKRYQERLGGQTSRQEFRTTSGDPQTESPLNE